MRRPVIAGNWKMFKTQAEARAYFGALAPLIAGSTQCDIIVAPPFTALTAAVEAGQGSSVSISAQNVCRETEGAFTGEVSAAMLIEAGCSAVIIGHSERRQFFGETDERVNKKIKAALCGGIDADIVRGRIPGSARAGRRKSSSIGNFAAVRLRWPARTSRASFSLMNRFGRLAPAARRQPK
jgi:triosephosphate isomerase